MRSNSGLQYPLSENIKNNKKTVDIKGEFKEVFFEGRSSAQGPPKENLNKVVIIGGGACGMATATKIRILSHFEIRYFQVIRILLTAIVEFLLF